MSYEWMVHLFLATGIFLIGTVVGSFLNVCIYRMPLEKSVIWPDSRCPKCLGRIGALQNIPILSWAFLGASCRDCKLRISARYPLIEALVGFLFVWVYFADAYFAAPFGRPNATVYLSVLYHCLFVAVLVAISFIDLDWTIVPASLTNFGLAAGLLLPMIDPAIRLAPATAATPLGALGVGLTGAIVGAGLVLAVRFAGNLYFGGESMGMGDVHILAVIGSVMGWQAAVLSFFLSAFFGLIPSLMKLVPYLMKRLTGRQWNRSDREIPLGPFLGLAALTLLLSWQWTWTRWVGPPYSDLAWLVRFLLGR